VSEDKVSYEELRDRLARAEAALDFLHPGEGDGLIGGAGDMPLRLKSLIEEKERLSREWQQTFDNVKDAVWILDAEQRIVRANRTAEEIFNCPADEMTGKLCCEVVHGTHEPILGCPMRRMGKSLRRERMELHYKERWFEVTVDPIKDGEHNLVGAVHIVSDITERKQMQDVLLESETRNRLIANLISDYAYIFRVNEQGLLTGEWITESFTKVFGLTLEEIDARGGWVSMVYLEDLPPALAHARKVAGGRADICEMRWLTAGGEVRWIRDYAQPVFDESGKRVVRIYGASQDITDRKRAEAERDRLIEAIEQAGEIIIMTDPQGTIKYVNPAFETVTGYTRKEALGQNPRMLKSGKQERAFYRDMWETITKGLIWQGRMVNRRKDGSIYTEESTISPVKDASGRILHYVAVKRDITERLLDSEEKAKLQEQLQQAQKLESIGRLAGGVAHDFNNMLSIILGYGDILLNKLHPQDPMRDAVFEIVEAGKRSAALTRQLLAFSRKQTLSPEVLSLNKVIKNLEKMLRRLIGEDIRMELRLSNDLSMTLADPGQIEQVIMNLSVNARDAMPGGGRLVIETGDADLDEAYVKEHPDSQAGRQVMLSISDTGCGMSDEVLSKIFEPFFTTKEQGKGTGLGLATVYGIVRQSGGHISVQSEPGKGSVFRIYLPPTTAVMEAKGPETAAEEVKGEGQQILLVEDEPSLRKLCQAVLSQKGYKVVSAANGGEALMLIEEKGLRPDLLVTDVILPGFSGMVLAERLLKSRPELKVLFMSGYTDETVARHGVLKPGTPFINKPFDIRNFTEKVRQVLSGR